MVVRELRDIQNTDELSFLGHFYECSSACKFACLEHIKKVLGGRGLLVLQQCQSHWHVMCDTVRKAEASEGT